MTTPPLLSVIGTIIQQVRGGRHFIWEMDGYPDVAIALNVFRAGSSFDRLTSVLADWARRRADGIIALGDCMRDRLVARGIPAPSIHVAENWANGTLIPYAPFPPLPWDALHVLYSGNLGLAHDIDTISEVMVRLRDDPRIRFTFAGGGVRRDALEAFCRERCLPSVQFTGYQEHARLGEHLASGHIGLVTQNPATLGCLVPSKTYALMASGRPVLFIGPDQSTIARTLARFRCGWQVDVGDVNGLVLLLQTLAENPEMVRAAGWRARVAFLDHYQSHHGITRIGEIIGFGVPAQAAVPQRSDVRWSEL